MAFAESGPEWLVYALAFASGAGLVYTVSRHFTSPLRERLRAELEDYSETLRDAFAEGIDPRLVLGVRYGGSLGLFVLVFFAAGSPVLALAAGAVLYFTPPGILDRAVRRRREKIESQVGELIQSLVATTKSGMNLEQSIEEVAERMAPPISQEFAMLLERLRAGQEMKAALLATEERLSIPNLSLVIRSLLVNQERGGPLPELLEKVSGSLREIERVEERVKTETAGIKLSSRIMALMPFVMGFLLYFMSPEYVTSLFDTLLGNAVLVTASALTYAGFHMIRNLAEMRV